MDNSLLAEGLNLMLYGMGVVFVFLTLLIFATQAMSSIIQHWFPEALPTPAPSKRLKRNEAEAVSPVTLKILQAAVDKHRARNR